MIMIVHISGSIPDRPDYDVRMWVWVFCLHHHNTFSYNIY